MNRFLVSLIWAILAGSAFLAMASNAEAVCRGDCGYWPGYYAYAPGYAAGYNAPGYNYPYAPAYNYAPGKELRAGSILIEIFRAQIPKPVLIAACSALGVRTQRGEWRLPT
jgi:hypothetical protein